MTLLQLIQISDILLFLFLIVFNNFTLKIPKNNITTIRFKYNFYVNNYSKS